MPRLIIIYLLSVINERVIFIAFRNDSCMHVWMFMCRSNSCIFLWKDLSAYSEYWFLALMVQVFLSFLATSLLRCRRSGCWFVLSVLFRSFYLLVLCLIYCPLLYDPFVSFYPSIVLRHHCTYVCIIFHCELVILYYDCEFLPAARLCLFIIIITIIVISI